MSRVGLIGLIGGIFWAGLWVEQSAIATHQDKAKKVAVDEGENKMDAVAIEILHVPYTRLSSFKS